MPISSIDGKTYNTTWGPYSSNIRELKIFFTLNTTGEVKSPFLFDSGCTHNYLTRSTFIELCEKSNLPSDCKFNSTYSAVIADGTAIKFPYLERALYIKLEDNFYFNIPFIINERIHRNIIGTKYIPEDMRWVIGKGEFYILKDIVPQKDLLLKTLLTAVHKLQGMAKTIKEDEDSRNGFIALFLNMKGFFAKDQTRWGSSASGLSAGEVDIKVENQDRETESIIEAFNLKNLNRRKINSHLQKLFGYDPSGLPRNYLVVYAGADDFYGLWAKYLRHLGMIKKEFQITQGPEEEVLLNAGVRLARTRHALAGKEVEVKHLFVKMTPWYMGPKKATRSS